MFGLADPVRDDPFSGRRQRHDGEHVALGVADRERPVFVELERPAEVVDEVMVP